MMVYQEPIFPMVDGRAGPDEGKYSRFELLITRQAARTMVARLRRQGKGLGRQCGIWRG